MALSSLIGTGTKVWLDGVEPAEIREQSSWGITGATSNPTIVSKIVGSGQCDDRIREFLDQGLTDYEVAWAVTNDLVASAQRVFRPVWDKSEGDDGYVSFELDPLIESEICGLDSSARAQRYIDLGTEWAKGQSNRMIKVPATASGLEALEPLAAAGVNINVTLMFTPRQYFLARDAVWRGARRRRDGLRNFKSVYSIFVSRVDAYVEKYGPRLDEVAQGMVGIVNAKRIWRENKEFWADKELRLRQEIVFASTGVKKPGQPFDLYAAAFAGGDIETNPAATNAAIEAATAVYTPQIARMPEARIIEEIDTKVNMMTLEESLMEEGTAKFAGAQTALLKMIAQKRAAQSPGDSIGRRSERLQ